MRGWLLGLLVLSAACVASPDRAESGVARALEPTQVHWQRSLEDALALQKATGRPLFLAVNTDAESASERIVREVYRDPRFVALTRSFVCLIGSPLRHAARDHDGEGRRVPDPRFGSVLSGEAVALEPILFERYLGGDRIAPRHALIEADGTKVFDLFQLYDFDELARALEEAGGAVETTPELEPAARIPRGADAAARAEGWAALAAARSARNRDAFERWLASASDGLLGEALDAIALHGDAGSLEALRVVLARAAPLGPDLHARIADTARALDLGGSLSFALWQQLLRLDRREGLPGLGGEAALLPLLGELGRDLETMEPNAMVVDPSTSWKGLRAYLLSYLALGAPDERARAAEALERLIGAEELARVDAALEAAGGAFDAPGLWAHVIAHRTPPPPPAPEEAPADEEALTEELARLERARGEDRDDPRLALAQARAALALARARLAAGGSGADFLLEDALADFDLALAAQPDDVPLRLERARAAFLLSRFAEQERSALEGLAVLDRLEEPPTGDGWRALVPATDTRVEAHRWLGDAAARLVLERFGDDPAVEARGLLHAGRSLALVAAGPESDETDWVGLTSFFGAIGRRREELAFVREGLARFPESDRLRATLHALAASSGRPDLAEELARELAEANPDSGACAWYHGWTLLNAAEWSRRGEAPARALERYAASDDAFQRSQELEPTFTESASYYRALGTLGSGFAHLLAEDRAGAAEELVRGIELWPDIAGARDGLDREALDLLDGALEWRVYGASPVDALALAERLTRITPESPDWARAVSDSELREALRAAGRGEEDARVEAYLATSIEAARRALTIADGEPERRALAQSLTVWAERDLEHPEADLVAVAERLAEAASAMDLESPEEGADRAALEALAADLRERLGEARPVTRPGR